jgi:transposase
MKKNTYRSTPIQQVTVESVLKLLTGATALVLAFDVAKHKMMFAIATAVGETLQIVRFDHPTETRAVLALLDGLRAQGIAITAVMEPTGTYGTVLRHHLVLREVPVFMIDPKRSHDAALVFDGVPSMHDAKACTILAKLHAQRLGREWRARGSVEKHARNVADQHRLAARPFEQLTGELEARVAEVWPELQALVGENVSWHLHLLGEFGDPSSVSASKPAARELLVRVSHGALKAERIDEVLRSADTSLGVPIDGVDRELLRMVAKQMLVLRDGMQAAKAQAETLVNSSSAPASLRHVATMLGAMTACVVFGDVGDPTGYTSAAALEKALGLNLKIRSSGENDGKPSLHITKRGPGRARKYLYLAALRAIRQYAPVRRWYERRTAYAGELKRKAVIAVMRKLVRALFHVARGAPFDATKLFDMKRLGLVDAPSPASMPSTLATTTSSASLCA